MFKDNFVRLCNERGVAPTVVCVAIGLQKSAFSNWSNTSVPRLTTLLKIADYFGVTVDHLLGKEQDDGFEPEIASKSDEKELLDIFRRMNLEQRSQAVSMLRIFLDTK